MRGVSPRLAGEALGSNMSIQMGLHEAPLNRSVRIARIVDPQTRMQLLRLGITEGSEVICEQRLPFGPVVLRHRHNRLALGRRIARDIHVAVA